MAIAFEGFSIREFTSKIRAENVEDCWPFDGNVSEMKRETVEELLPPITIKKFKWWSDELERLEKEGKMVLEEEEEKERKKVVTCPVCLSFKSSSINTMASHVDSCLSQASRKERKKIGAVGPKSKQPKKRSIMEIFAVAPQVEDEEEDEMKQENMRVRDILANVKKKKRSKSEERLAVIMKKLKKASRKILKKKNANKGRSCLRKEQTYKPKRSIQLGLVGKLKSSINEKKWTSKTQSSSKPNKFKAIQVSEFGKEYQEPTKNPVHGILKKCNSVSEETSTVGNTDDGDQTKVCHQVGKHVQFSDQDCILGDSSSVDHLQIQNSCDVLSDSMVLSSLNSQLEMEDNVSPATDEIAEVNGNRKEVVSSVTRGSGVQSVDENEGSNDINAPIVPPTIRSSNNRIQKDRALGLFEEPVRLTRGFPPQEKFNRLGKSQSSYYSPYVGIPKVQNSFQASARSLLDICANPNLKSAATSSTRTATLESLASSLAMRREADSRAAFLSQDKSQNLDSWDLQCRPFLRLSPKDPMTSTSSFADRKQKKSSVYGKKFIDDDFIGLPLNSHGELIKSHSSGKGGMDQLKKQNTVNAVSNFPGDKFLLRENTLDHSNKGKRYSVGAGLLKDKPKWIPDPKYLKTADISSELQGTGRTEFKGKNQSLHHLGLDLNQINIMSSQSGNCAENRNQSEKEKIRGVEYTDHGFVPITQPTMRLMGKDVTVGSVKGSDDGKVWTDKNVIEENLPAVAFEKSSLGRNSQLDATTNASSGKSQETRSQSLGSQEIPTRPFFPQMSPTACKSAHTYDSILPQSRPELTTERQSVQLRPFSCSLSSEESMHGALRMPGSSIHGETHNLSSQIRSASQYPCHCMRFNSSQLLYNQGPPQRPSSFQFPFANQVCAQCVQPSHPRSSSKDLPHWMLDVSQKKESPFGFSGHSTSLENNPYNTSPYSTSMVSQSSHPVRSLNPTEDSPDIYLVQRPLVPVPPSVRLNSSINTSYRNRINLKNKMNPHRKDADHFNYTKKRPADRIDSSTKYSKKAYLELPLSGTSADDLEAPEIDLNRENGRGGLGHSVAREVNLSGYSIHDIRSTDLDINKVSGIDGEHPQMEIDNDGLRASYRANSSNMDNVARSGPIKLCAGVKHILKPSLNIDQDNSRPIYSTIPFGSANNSGKGSDLQKKPSMVYRL